MNWIKALKVLRNIILYIADKLDIDTAAVPLRVLVRAVKNFIKFIIRIFK